VVIEGDDDMTNAPLPGKQPNKAYEVQGWNAKNHGFKAEDCPYYASSTAAKHWLKGFNS
jgi:ribosome modulation factor